MVLSCPHCANNAPYMRRDFCGQWVVCPKCETPFRWREAGTVTGAEPPAWHAVGAAEREIER